jgi:hypothetical protein
MRAMSGLLPGDFFSLAPDTIQIERKGLAAVARAVKQCNGQRASDEYVRMMQRVGEKVVRLFEDRGLFHKPDEPADPSATRSPSRRRR